MGRKKKYSKGNSGTASSDDHLRQLLAACQWGGFREEIQELLNSYDYTVEDLEQALSMLESSGTSAAEINTARDNIRFLESRIRGMKMSK